MQPLERHPPPHAPHPNLINEPENLIRACACMGRTELDAALTSGVLLQNQFDADAPRL
jgi:hypothetical protein